MKNVDSWRPTKFVYRNGRLDVSRDPRDVSVGSRLFASRVARCYDEHLKQYAHGRLIDLGCGKVPLYQAYKDLVSENVCVDWSNSKHANPHLDLECDLTRQLPFEPGEFETVILSDVLEHIPNPEQLWSEMGRILKRGGHLLMNVPYFYCLHEIPYDFYRYTEFSLRRFADISGFQVDRLETLGGTCDILADILAKHVQFLPLVGRPAAAAIQSAADLFARMRIGKRVWEKTSTHFPAGYFLVAQKV